MKTFKIIVLFMFLALMGTSMTSCAVRLTEKQKNNGQHRGWYKNKNKHNHKVYIIKKGDDKHSKYKTSGKDKKKNKKR